MPSGGFEPVIPAIEGLQTYAFDREARGIGDYELVPVFRARYWKYFKTKINKYLFVN
jgi:hypothetical protein